MVYIIPHTTKEKPIVRKTYRIRGKDFMHIPGSYGKYPERVYTATELAAVTTEQQALKLEGAWVDPTYYTPDVIVKALGSKNSINNEARIMSDSLILMDSNGAPVCLYVIAKRAVYAKLAHCGNKDLYTVPSLYRKNLNHSKRSEVPEELFNHSGSWYQCETLEIDIVSILDSINGKKYIPTTVLCKNTFIMSANKLSINKTLAGYSWMNGLGDLSSVGLPNTVRSIMDTELSRTGCPDGVSMSDDGLPHRPEVTGNFYRKKVQGKRLPCDQTDIDDKHVPVQVIQSIMSYLLKEYARNQAPLIALRIKDLCDQFITIMENDIHVFTRKPDELDVTNTLGSDIVIGGSVCKAEAGVVNGLLTLTMFEEINLCTDTVDGQPLYFDDELMSPLAVGVLEGDYYIYTLKNYTVQLSDLMCGDKMFHTTLYLDHSTSYDAQPLRYDDGIIPLSVTYHFQIFIVRDLSPTYYRYSDGSYIPIPTLPTATCDDFHEEGLYQLTQYDGVVDIGRVCSLKTEALLEAGVSTSRSILRDTYDHETVMMNGKLEAMYAKHGYQLAKSNMDMNHSRELHGQRVFENKTLHQHKMEEVVVNAEAKRIENEAKAAEARRKGDSSPSGVLGLLDKSLTIMGKAKRV